MPITFKKQLPGPKLDMNIAFEDSSWLVILDGDCAFTLETAAGVSKSSLLIQLQGTGTITWPDSITFSGSTPQPNGDSPVYVELVSIDGDNWYQPSSSQSGGPSSLGIWLYGDGSDGPIAFTATPRTITDGAFVVGSTTFESDTADFTDDDIGLVLNDQDGSAAIQVGVRIIAVTDPSHAEMSCPFSNDGVAVSGDTVVIGDTNFQPGMYSSVTVPTGASFVPTQVQGDQGYLCSGEFNIDGIVELSGSGFVGDAETGPGDNPSTVGPRGGNGGAGSASETGDTPGGICFSAAVTDQYRQPLFLLQNLIALVPSALGGGGGGGGDGVNTGGRGGAPGGVWAIAAKSIVHGPNAVYQLTGAPGEDGSEGGNCGGGGGGGDGWWVTLSDSISGTPSIVGGGGAPGAGSGTGADGTAGQPGFGVHYTPTGVTVQTP